MKVVCAWCQQEGRPSLFDEREPVEDPSETHGICPMHQAEVLRELHGRDAGVSAVMVVRRGDSTLYDYLAAQAGHVSWLRVIVDRRRTEPRQPPAAVASERRVGDRRVLVGRPIAAGCVLVTLPLSRAGYAAPRIDDSATGASTESLPAFRTAHDLDHDVEVLRQWTKKTERIIADVLPDLLRQARSRERRERHPDTLVADAAADYALQATLPREPPRATADDSTLVAELVERSSHIARITMDLASRLRKQVGARSGTDPHGL